jgi:hypothetical protein
MTFNGTTDYIETAGCPLSAGTQDFTVEGWFYPTVIAGTQYGRGLIYFHTGTTARFGLRTNGATGNLDVYMTDAAGTVQMAGGPGSNIAMSLNTWIHIAVVRTAGYVTIYFNGVNVGSSALSTTFALPAYTTTSIGYSTDGTTNTWAGNIEDLRVTNGIARYTTNFSVPKASFAITTVSA